MWICVLSPWGNIDHQLFSWKIFENIFQWTIFGLSVTFLSYIHSFIIYRRACNNNVNFVCFLFVVVYVVCIMKNIYYYIEKKQRVCCVCAVIWQGRDLIFDLSAISYVLRYIYSFLSIHSNCFIYTLWCQSFWNLWFRVWVYGIIRDRGIHL